MVVRHRPILAVAVIIGLISLRGLQNHVKRLAQTTTTEEQARRDLLKPSTSSPTDVPAEAKIFWANGPAQIVTIRVVLPLSAEPVTRATGEPALCVTNANHFPAATSCDR